MSNRTPAESITGDMFNFKENEDYIVDTSVGTNIAADENVDDNDGTSTISIKSPVESSEREQIYSEMDSLRQERDKLRRELIQSNLEVFSFDALQKNNSACTMLTGLKNCVLEKLVKYLCQNIEDDERQNKCNFDQVVLTIIKLKQNMKFDLLAYVCKISKTTAIEYFHKWIDIMCTKLRFLIRMQDRDHIFENIPTVFKGKFPKLTCIIDCFEVFVEAPSSFLARSQLYSQYKNTVQLKFLFHVHHKVV